MAEDFLPTTIDLDGMEVPIRIVRFDFASRNAFSRDFDKLEIIYNHAAALNRLALVKAGMPTKPETPELIEDAPPDETAEVKAERLIRNVPILKRNAEKLRVHSENITLALALRELDDTPAQRAKREALDVENDRFAARFIQETFERFVSVDPGYELIDPEGRRVQSGIDLLRSYPSPELYSTVLGKVLMQNMLAADLKKKLASPSASAPSSDEKSETSLTANGDRPAPTAGSVSTVASAQPAGATG